MLVKRGNEMSKPSEAASAAEKQIANFVNELDCRTPDDIANVLEMLVSKSAKAVEKYCGTERAKLICDRTAYYLVKRHY